MCIAILNKKGSVISDEALTNSFLNNNDGGGFAFINQNNELTIIKGIFDLQNFIETYHTIKKISKSDILIHCRIGTSGNKDKDNTHPHKINNRLVLIHNGILNIKVPDKSKKSDTRIFIETYLKNLTPEHLQDKTFIEVLQGFIGCNNKFVIMDDTGKATIINAKYGIYDKQGNWFSNNSYTYCYYTEAITDYYKLNRKDRKYLKDTIQALNDYDLWTIGEYPLLELETLKLKSDSSYTDYTKTYIYLEDIDPKLYELYLSEYDLKVKPYIKYL